MRMYENTLPILLSSSRYAYRIPIGDMTVIRNVTRGQLLSFYHRWYCPNRQTVIVIGDFDTDRMEQMVKQTMSRIPKCGDAKGDDELSFVPDHQGVTYALHTDPEASATMTYLMFEHQQTSIELRNTYTYLKHNVISFLVQNMLTERLEEMARTSGSAIDHAGVYDRKFLVARTRDALTLAALVKEGRSLEALDSLTTQAARAVQHGFTKGELERAQRNAHAVYADYQAEASNRKSQEYVEEYIDHYENGGYIPGVVTESQMLIDEVQQITLDEVNDSTCGRSLARIT